MATYAIGDIHGSLTALESIFECGVITHEDIVVFLGDYIDRGPDSKGVLDWLINNKGDYQFYFILGNHEILMKTAVSDHQRTAEWVHFGGGETLASYGIRTEDVTWAAQIPPSYWAFIDQCKPYLELDDFIFVHAGLEAGKSLAEQNRHHLFWKSFETPSEYSPSKTVICGHTPRKNGRIADFGHTICIDTYAYGGKWLTCLNVNTKEYIQANNQGAVQFGRL